MNKKDYKIPEKLEKMEEVYKLMDYFNKTKRKFFFRGQENSEWNLNSSWIRREKNEKIQKILRKNLIIFDDIAKKLRMKFGNKNIIEILAELQHSKDSATPLIDLTNNFLISLWFAVGSSKSENNAAIFVFQFEDNEIIENIISKKIGDYYKKIIFSPFISKRAISQRSYFLIDNINWKERTEKVIKITIKKKLIEKMQKFLSYKMISNTIIFPDLKGAFLNAMNFNWGMKFLDGIIKNYSGKYEKAIKDYNKAIELNPKYSIVYYNRGTTYAKIGDRTQNTKKYEKAIENYNKAIELNPNDSAAYYNRGTTYAKIGDRTQNTKKYEKAIEDYEKAIELNPNDSAAYYNRGTAYSKIGDRTQNTKKYEKAIEDYEKAIELNPKYSIVYYNRGTTYAKIGDRTQNTKKYEKAIEDYEKAIELNPNDSAAYYNRGTAYSKIGDRTQNTKKYEKAIEDYEKAIELNPKNELAIINKKMLYEKLNKK